MIDAAMPGGPGAALLCAARNRALAFPLTRNFALGGSKYPGGRSKQRRCFRVPRYFFHLKRGQLTVIDKEGIELRNVEEAAKGAARRGRQIAESEALKGILPGGGLIIVEDEWDANVLEHPF